MVARKWRWRTKVGAPECWVIGTRPPSTPAGPKWPTETSVPPPSGGSYRRFSCAIAYRCAVFTNAVHVQSRQWMHPARIFSLAPRSPFLFIVLLRRFMLIRRETSRLNDVSEITEECCVTYREQFAVAAVVLRDCCLRSKWLPWKYFRFTFSSLIAWITAYTKIHIVKILQFQIFLVSKLQMCIGIIYLIWMYSILLSNVIVNNISCLWGERISFYKICRKWLTTCSFDNRLSLRE